MSRRVLRTWLSASVVMVLPGLLGTLAFAVAPTTRPAPAPGPELDAPDGGRLVAVVKGPDADVTCQEIVTRIIAELTADGVSVVALTCAGADQACMAVSGSGVSAVVLVQRHDNVDAVEVRAGEMMGRGRSRPPGAGPAAGGLQRVVNLESGVGPAALAVRTVELLRAMLIEVADDPADDAVTTTPSVVEQKVEQKVDPASPFDLPLDDPTVVPMGRYNLTIDIGAYLVGGFPGLETAYGPALTVGRRTSDHMLVSVMLAGPAFGRDQANAAGRIAVRHEAAIARADLLGLFWNRIVLRGGIGAGVYHVQIEGQPTRTARGTIGADTTGLSPGSASDGLTIGRSAGAFSALLSWSAGVVANLSSDLGLFVDGRLFVITPTPVILLDGLEVGRASNPGLVVSAGVELRL